MGARWLDLLGSAAALTTEQPHILSISATELVQHAAQHGHRLSIEHARRILVDAWAHPRARRTRDTVPPRTRSAIAGLLRHDRVEIIDRATDSNDGFVKYLLRTTDGAEFEAVRIPLHRPGRYSVCLSSQVGCAMQCAFCATGRLGLSRNLAAWEILSSFVAVRDEAPGRVSGAVFQGQGEPFHNYDEVIRTAARLRDPCGAAISGAAITISTVGLVPQIRRFSLARLPYRLIVSLTTTDLVRRRNLLPIASRFAIEDLAEAVREYQAIKGGRVTLAWVLMSGQNSGADEVARLVDLFDRVPIIVNIIDVNDTRPHGFTRASDAERGELLDRLAAAGIPFIRRYSGGAAQHAACGMLAATRGGTFPPPDRIGV